MAPETSEHLVVLYVMLVVMMAGDYGDAEHSLMRTLGQMARDEFVVICNVGSVEATELDPSYLGEPVGNMESEGE